MIPPPGPLSPEAVYLIQARHTPLAQQLAEPNQATAHNHHPCSLPQRPKAMKDWYIALLAVAAMIYRVIALCFA